jgi:hypothetical protein
VVNRLLSLTQLARVAGTRLVDQGRRRAPQPPQGLGRRGYRRHLVENAATVRMTVGLAVERPLVFRAKAVSILFARYEFA